MDYEINLKNVRISYPHLFEPFTYQGVGKGKYSAKFLLSKQDHANLIKEIGLKVKQIATEFFKDKRLPPADKLFMRDGDLSGREEEEGHWLISASESTRPLVVNRDLSRIEEVDDVIHPGCYVNAKISLWAQDNQYGKRVNANLIGVQFVAEGERLGKGRTHQVSEGMFDRIGDTFGDADAGDDVPF